MSQSLIGLRIKSYRVYKVKVKENVDIVPTKLICNLLQ